MMLRNFGIALLGISLVTFGGLEANATRPRTTVAPTQAEDFTSSAPAHLPPSQAESRATDRSSGKETYPYADAARTGQSSRNVRTASPSPGESRSRTPGQGR